MDPQGIVYVQIKQQVMMSWVRIIFIILRASAQWAYHGPYRVHSRDRAVASPKRPQHVPLDTDHSVTSIPRSVPGSKS